MDYTHFGKNLAFYRRLHHLSQLDLAIRTGGVVSQAYVSRAECGARQLNPTYVAALAAALRVDVKTLMRAPRFVTAVKDARVVVLRGR